jgi:glycosyltransferase involved in cell wall biosynthesis
MKNKSNTAAKPQVSIVLSNFNGGDWLKKSVASVLSQTFQNWELILIDDCSTDNSREIIESFKDARIRPFYFQQNQHMVYGFNFGISQAQGEYIARIDSDDCWYPEKLQQQVSFMDKNKEYGACFTWVNVIDEHDNSLSSAQTDRAKVFNVNNMQQHEWLHYLYFKGPCFCHSSALIRLAALNVVGIYKYALIQLQDYELWLRIVKKYPIYIIQTPLVNYRWFTDGTNASSPSAAVNTRSNFEFTYIHSKYFDSISDEQFIKSFNSEFIHKNKIDKIHLECEKIFLLLKPVFSGHTPKIGAMEKFIQLLQSDEAREVLWNDYYVNQKSFYELASNPVYYDQAMHDPIGVLKTIKPVRLAKEIIKRIMPNIFWNHIRKLYYFIKFK